MLTLYAFSFCEGERPLSRELTIIARAHDDGGKHAILSSTHQLSSFFPLRVVEEGNCPIFLGTRLFNKPFFCDGCISNLLPRSTNWILSTNTKSFFCVLFTHTFSDISDVKKSFERTLLLVDDPNFCHTRIVTKEETSHSKR